LILTCRDPRWDPREFWNLPTSTGPAIVRNAGGSAADAVFAIRALATISASRDSALGAVAVIHHLGCAAANYNDNSSKQKFRDLAQGDKGPVEGMLAGFNLEQIVRNDVALIKSDPLLPKDLEVVGFVYDVLTGKTKDVRSSSWTDAGATCDLESTRPT
ncbi:hypothetical protein K431DRAFT_236597, partial [Polychaeton citri CBS 116435]